MNQPNKVMLHLEREGDMLAYLGVYETLEDAKKAALSVEMMYEGCEVIAFLHDKTYMLVDDWEDITEDDNEGQPDWEQEWEDFGETYDDEPNYI